MQHLSDAHPFPGDTAHCKAARLRSFRLYVGCGRVMYYAGRLSYPQELMEEILAGTCTPATLAVSRVLPGGVLGVEVPSSSL
jgi:hypothetical protein